MIQSLRDKLDDETLQDYVKLYGKRDLKFDPGTKWEDSNYGFLQRTDAAMARNLGGRRLHDGGRSDEFCRRADVKQTIEGRDARRGHGSAIHDGRLRLRIPDRTAGRGADLRPRRRRSGNERDSSRVSGVEPVGDRVVQPGQSFGFAPGRLAPRPHANQVVPTTGDGGLESRIAVLDGTRRSITILGPFQG